MSKRLRHHLDRHELDSRLLLADVAPDVPRTRLARSDRHAASARVWASEGDSATSRCSARSTRSRQFQREVTAGTTFGFLPLRPARCGARRTARSSRSASQDLSALPLRMLSGEEEAAASYRGAITGLRRAARRTRRRARYRRRQHRIRCRHWAGAGATRLVRNRRRAFDRSRAGAGRPRRRRRASRGRARARVARKALAPSGECAAVERLAFVGGTATTTAGDRARPPNADRFLRFRRARICNARSTRLLRDDDRGTQERSPA